MFKNGHAFCILFIQNIHTKGVFIIYVRGGELELAHRKLHTPPLQRTKVTYPPLFDRQKLPTPLSANPHAI